MKTAQLYLKKEILNTVFGACSVNMSDEDILIAMKSIPGYLDITPGDFKEIFHYAYRHAIERIAQSLLAKDVMTTKVISVNPNTSLKETAFAEKNINRMPVLGKNGHMVGIVARADIFRTACVL